MPHKTLIISGNDVLAAGAMRAANRLGISVPDTLSITGFDDIELSEILVPALTTVHVPHREMGRLAAEALLVMSEKPDATIHTELSTYVVERNSLAKPSH